MYDTACNRHSNETATLRKHVTKYKNMQKYIVKFLRKFENRGMKIARINSILFTKYINLELLILLTFCTLLGSVVIEGDFP